MTQKSLQNINSKICFSASIKKCIACRQKQFITSMMESLISQTRNTNNEVFSQFLAFPCSGLYLGVSCIFIIAWYLLISINFTHTAPWLLLSTADIHTHVHTHREAMRCWLFLCLTHTLTDYTDKWLPLPGGKLNIWICRVRALRCDKIKRVKRKRKSDNWSAKSSDGKRGDLHSLNSVVSWRVTAPKRLWSLSLCCFLFGPCLGGVDGGLLGERIRMSVATPFCPSWDTILSLSLTSAYR